MNKFYKLAGVAAFTVVALGVSVSGYAADTIQFTGRVVGESCALDTAITTGAGTVALGDVPISVVTTAGGKSPDTPFTVALTGCPANDAQISLTLAGTPNTNDTQLLAVAGGTPATGVGIAVFDNTSGTPVQLDFSTTAQTAPLATDADGKVAFNFIANIMNDGSSAATAGDANATATLTVNYQ